MDEYDADPEVMLADRGYDSDAIRDDVRARGGRPDIPTKKNRRVQHSVNQMLYATRNRIERFFNRLKNSRRVATRYDHTASSFLGFAKLATINSGSALSTRPSGKRHLFASRCVQMLRFVSSIGGPDGRSRYRPPALR